MQGLLLLDVPATLRAQALSCDTHTRMLRWFFRRHVSRALRELTFGSCLLCNLLDWLSGLRGSFVTDFVCTSFGILSSTLWRLGINERAL